MLDYFEEYALYSEAFNSTPEGIRNPGPHIAICDVEFERANRLLCFAILLGNQRTIPNIMVLVDYENPRRDGMLERLAACYIERPQPMPNACTRRSPYVQTLAIFTTPGEQRPGRMRDYLGKWYETSRNEPYHGTHAGSRFLGYWSWEAAAITIALGIDDRSYRDAQYYPFDLAEFARQTAHDRPADVDVIPAELRARAGEPCPAGGMWESIGVPRERVHFTQGSELRQLDSPYGLTMWRLVQA